MTQPSAALAGRRRPRPWAVPRALRVGVLAIAGVFALYLVVGNLLLRTRLLRHLLGGDEDRLLVDYDSAWTAIPGRVHVKNLTLRMQDDNVQLWLGIERVTVQLDPFSLAQRTFHATSVRADGVTFRVRHKLEHLRGQEGRAKAYPPIPGFSDPPLREQKPNLPIPESDYRLWTVELDEVAASVRDLWIMEYRYRGSASVAGSFRLKPLRELWIDPSVLVTDGGVMSLGGDDLLLRSKGKLEVRVEPYDVRVPKGAEILRHVTARATFEGDVSSIEPLVRMYAPNAPVIVRRGSGHLGVDARIGGGVLAKGARVTYATNDVEIDAPPGSVAGNVRVEALAGDELTAEAHVGAASLLLRGGKDAAVTVRDVHVEAGLGSSDIVRGPSLEALGATVAALSAPDLHGLSPLAPSGVTLEGGGATASLRATYRSGALEGRLDVGLDRARGRAGSMDLTASGRVWAGFVAADPRHFVAIGPCGADLSGVGLVIDGARADGLWATLRLHEAGVHPATGAGAGVHLEAGPGDRTLRLLSGLAKLPDIAAEAAGGSDLVADLRIDDAKGTVTVSLLHAKNGKLEARGRLATARSDTNGAFLFSVGPVTAGIEVKNGHSSVTPFVRGGWLDERLPP